MKEIFIGIDLGTTNTLACQVDGGKPIIIKIKGSKMLPSVLHVDKDKNIVIGKRAKKLGVLDPKNTIRSSKTYMADAKKKWTVGGLTFTPTEVATEILKEVKAQVIEKLHLEKDTKINAVITVPAYFTGNQKDETKKAGVAAGLNVIQIITEPMAAAVAAVRELELNEKIFVVDLGGGTFDISVLQADRANNTYRAIDLAGDKKLGGDDFDKMLYDYFIGIIQDDLGIDLSSQKKSGLTESDYNSMTGRIREAAETAKIDLSENTEYTIDLANLFFHKGRNYDFNTELTREDFENICKPLFDKIISRIKKFIAESDRFKVSDIGTIILAGGSCYIPKVKADVEKIFNKRADSQLNLDTLVVVGAAIVADPNLISKPIVEDILAHSLGIEVISPDGKKLILSKILNKGEKYPCESSKIYTTTDDNQTTVPIFIYEAGSDAEDVEDIDAHEYYGDVSLENIAPAPAGVPNIKVTFRYDISGTVVVEAQDEQSGVKNIIEIKKGDKEEHKKKRRKKQRPIDFMLLLDVSGSMYDEPLREATQACEILFNDMINFDIHKMGFITFETYTRRLVPLTQDKNRLKNALRNLSAGGGTNLADALRCANEDLAESSNIKVVIIVTDGQPFDEDFTLDYAERMKDAGIRIVTIGAGSEVKESFIKKVSSSPDDAYKIDNMSKLQETFKTALKSIEEKK
ncbi:MAG: Hsp70 family protein [Selenomonadaceae bacterium]|nr:Hsp70 family protein [Selenomonadaceae bacterium]